MHRVYTPCCRILLAVMIFAVYSSVHAQQADFLREIQSKLAYEENGGVFDFGEHLKKGGERELAELADEFQKDGLRLWVVTLPEEYPANAAERLCTNLSFTEADILIVFNSKQVYGKALALKGEKELFTKYLAESRRSFNQYWAKGLAHYAGLLRGRIVEKGKKKEFRRNLTLFSILGAVAAVFLTVAAIIFASRTRSRRAYQEKLSRVDLLFGELGEKIGEPGMEEYTDRFLELSERREKLQASQKHTVEEADGLISDMESFIAQLEKDDTV